MSTCSSDPKNSRNFTWVFIYQVDYASDAGIVAAEKFFHFTFLKSRNGSATLSNQSCRS